MRGANADGMNFARDAVGLILVIVGGATLLLGAIAGCLVCFVTPGIPFLKRLLEYPWPTVGFVCAYIVAKIGLKMLEYEEV